MGGYFSILTQYWWPEPEQEIEYKVTEMEIDDGKNCYWWETTTGSKRVIKGWFRYHPDELKEFHKENKHAQLDESILGSSSSHVTFMKVDLDKLMDLSVQHNKRDIIKDFTQTKAFSHK